VCEGDMYVTARLVLLIRSKSSGPQQDRPIAIYDSDEQINSRRYTYCVQSAQTQALRSTRPTLQISKVKGQRKSIDDKNDISLVCYTLFDTPLTTFYHQIK
jgi:hypothetical protein